MYIYGVTRFNTYCSRNVADYYYGTIYSLYNHHNYYRWYTQTTQSVLP